MTPRERVVRAIEFSGPDRVPHRHCCLPASFAAHPRLPELYAEYPSDFAGEDPEPPGRLAREFSVGQYTDQWQCTWTVLREGYIGQMTGHPLDPLDRLSEYCVPDSSEDPGLDDARRVAESRTDRYVCVGWMTMYERMIGLCGFENLLYELACGNPAIPELRDRIVDYNVGLVEELLKLDPDGIYFADDWGTQKGLMISPGTWRELFLPAYQRMFRPVRAAGKHVFFHTDGYTIEILPDLVAAGVNVFWADLTVNPLDRLHGELGGKVCFQGLTDVQFILRGGTPQQVEQHGRDLIAALGSFNGGLIGCSEVGADQPWENVVAILRSFHDHGRYPLRLSWTPTGARDVPK